MNKFSQLLKPRVVFLTSCFLVIMASSCTSEIDLFGVPPVIELSEKNNDIEILMGETINFSATKMNDAEYTEEWSLEGNVTSSTATYDFIPEKTGTYIVTYKSSNNAGVFRNEYTIVVNAVIRPITEESNLYVTTLLDYLPAPGQRINSSIGTLEGAKTLEGKKGMVTLGAWGGTVSYTFDHTVINTEDAADIMMYGNAFSGFAEPGVVWVMQDENANGIADDTWYEIKGSADALEGTIKNYSVTYSRPNEASEVVTWTDSEGESGVISTKFYPEFITEDSYTITGTLLTDNNIDMSNPSWIKSNAFEYGYADNTPGGDKLDISDAVDNEGNTVNLTGIDFIKVQTGILANMGWLGELSTEVTGIADLNMLDN